MLKGQTSLSNRNENTRNLEIRLGHYLAGASLLCVFDKVM
jgi:hypothetical protein